MTAQGKANYEGYRKAAGGVSLVSGQALPEYDMLGGDIRWAWDAGADAVALVLADMPVDEDAPGGEPAKPARVIVVIEPGGRERRYAADAWDSDGEQRLTLSRTVGESRMGVTDHRDVAEHAPGTWTSVREEGALLGDQGHVIATLRAALARVVEACNNDDPGAARDLAVDALAATDPDL